MRRFAHVLTLLLAACASETRAPVTTPPPNINRHQHGRLIGLTVPQLGELFGAPNLQIREGPGLKLQYRGGGCILDAYLYAPASGQGVERTTHVDTRLPSGADTDQVGCEAAIEGAR